MPKIVFLPHEEICPEGAAIDAEPGQSVCRAALDNGIDVAQKDGFWIRGPLVFVKWTISQETINP